MREKKEKVGCLDKREQVNELEREHTGPDSILSSRRRSRGEIGMNLDSRSMVLNIICWMTYTDNLESLDRIFRNILTVIQIDSLKSMGVAEMNERSVSYGGTVVQFKYLNPIVFS